MCRVRTATPVEVRSNGRPVRITHPEPGVIAFATVPGASYVLTAAP